MKCYPQHTLLYTSDGADGVHCFIGTCPRPPLCEAWVRCRRFRFRPVRSLSCWFQVSCMFLMYVAPGFRPYLSCTVVYRRSFTGIGSFVFLASLRTCHLYRLCCFHLVHLNQHLVFHEPSATCLVECRGTHLSVVPIYIYIYSPKMSSPSSFALSPSAREFKLQVSSWNLESPFPKAHA